MGKRPSSHTSTYISCSSATLRVSDPTLPQCGTDVKLLARRSTADGSIQLLVEQDAMPRLLEISAESTNFNELQLVDEKEPLKLVPSRLQTAIQLISEFNQKHDPDDISDLIWKSDRTS